MYLNVCEPIPILCKKPISLCINRYDSVNTMCNYAPVLVQCVFLILNVCMRVRPALFRGNQNRIKEWEIVHIHGKGFLTNSFRHIPIWSLDRFEPISLWKSTTFYRGSNFLGKMRPLREQGTRDLSQRGTPPTRSPCPCSTGTFAPLPSRLFGTSTDHWLTPVGCRFQKRWTERIGSLLVLKCSKICSSFVSANMA